MGDEKIAALDHGARAVDEVDLGALERRGAGGAQQQQRAEAEQQRQPRSEGQAGQG
jgi:hypothetical protein